MFSASYLVQSISSLFWVATHPLLGFRMLIGLLNVIATPFLVMLTLLVLELFPRVPRNNPLLLFRAQRLSTSPSRMLPRIFFGSTSSSRNFLSFITSPYHLVSTATTKVPSTYPRMPLSMVIPSISMFISILSAKPLPLVTSSCSISPPRRWLPTFLPSLSHMSNSRDSVPSWMLCDHVHNEGEC